MLWAFSWGEGVKKAFIAAAVLAWILLSFVSALPTGTGAPAPFSWTDHMDYSSLAELEAGGWTVSQPTHTYLNQSSVVLEYVEPPTSISHRGFPAGIYDWRAEVRGMWTVGSGGGVQIGVVTENHSYIWSLDGWYSDFILYRDSAVALQFGSMPLIRYQWYVMAMEMRGGSLSFYLNGGFVGNYTESSSPSQAVGMDSVCPYQSSTQYDYYHFTEIVTSEYSNPWISWRDVIGGPASDTGYAAAAAGDGGFALLGVTKSYGHGGIFDAFVVKVDYAGNEIWNRTFGGASGNWGYSITNSTDGGFVIAGATMNATVGHFKIWLFKISGNGTLIWDRQLGNGTLDAAFGVTRTNDGGYAVVGYKSQADLYLIKTDSTGIMQWERTYGGSGRDWGRSVIQTSDGGYALSGYTQSFTSTSQAYIVRTDAAGTMLWQNHFGTGNSNAFGILEMPDGGFVLSGQTDGGGNGLTDFFAVRTDSSGNHLWDNTYGGSKNDYGYSVFRTSDGLIFGGWSASFDPTFSKIYMVATDEQGNQLWDSTFGLPNTNISGSVDLHNADGTFLAVGNTNIYNSGSDDVVAIRIAGVAGIAPQLPIDNDFIQQAAGPAAAIAVGSVIGLLAVALASPGNALLAVGAGKAASSASGSETETSRGFRIKMFVDFVIGYFKTHISGKFFKMLGKVEPEKGVAQMRHEVFLTFSTYELSAITFASVVLGITFLIAAKKELLQLDILVLYILVAGLVVIVDDLMHRFAARRYKVTSEYQFWWLGTGIMLLTGILFGSVFGLPARTTINNTEKLTPKQRAVIYGIGPITSFLVFIPFLLLIPAGGFIASVGILGASMNLLSAVYSFMPFDPMDGNKVYRWKKPGWLMAFAPLLALYFAMVIWVF